MGGAGRAPPARSSAPGAATCSSSAQRPEAGKPASEAVAPGQLFVVTNSDALEQATVELGADPARIRRISGMPNIDRFSPERADRLGCAAPGWAGPRRLRSPSRCETSAEHEHRHGRAGRSPASGARLEPRACSRHGGAGVDAEADEALVDERGLGRTRVHRASLGRGDLPGLAASCDASYRSRGSESSPASLLEWMARALPAVCASAPSIDEWVEQGEGAEIVPPGTWRPTAAAILRLIREPELGRAVRGAERPRRAREQVGDPGRELEDLYRGAAARYEGSRARHRRGRLRARHSLLAEGKLPTARLARRGSFGPLRSTVPAFDADRLVLLPHRA